VRPAPPRRSFPSTMKSLVLLALGAFAIGTEGYAIAGLLPEVAADVGVSVAVAGQLITAFSLAFAIGSPLLAVATGGWERKRLLISSIVIFGLFNLLAASAHTYATLFVARVGLALSAGAFMPAASAYAVAVSPVKRRGRALSIIYSGLTVAMLVGVPIGVLVGNRFGWRSIFVGTAAVSFATMIGLVINLVPLTSSGTATLTQRLKIARHPAILGALAVTVIFMTGVFSIYTYIAPFLQQTSGLAGNAVALVLFFFGIGATVGNLASGSLVDRLGPRRILTTALLCLAALFMTISLAASTLPPATARYVIVSAIGLWGVVGFSIPSAQQIRLTAIAPRYAPIVLSLNASAAYLGVSLGSMLGSVIVARHSVVGLSWTAALCELFAFAALMASYRKPRSTFTNENELRAEALAPLASASGPAD